MKSTFLAWTPFTGLGAYGGFRGNRWLRNRIKVFKQFVIPSLLNQDDRDFIHWIAWRPEERNNPYVRELEKYMMDIPNYRFVFTFGGLCFWDDKYPNDEARTRLTLAIHRTFPKLSDLVPEDHEVQVLLVPSDDLYTKNTISTMRSMFDLDPFCEAIGYVKGYICNYNTREILEYNPKTNPPFFAARFPRETFFDPYKHLDYISMKKDEGKYNKGTPYPSHEYIPNAFRNMKFIQDRGFMVGTHGENISTHFNHPFGGARILPGVAQSMTLRNFGIYDTGDLVLPISIRKWVMRKLPHRWQRKLRYMFGEKLFQRFYNFIRN